MIIPLYTWIQELAINCSTW